MEKREARDESVESEIEAQMSLVSSEDFLNSDKNEVVPCSSGNLQVSPNNGRTAEDTFSQDTVFPLEIWEMILNFLHDSESVQNVLLAFPSLFGSAFEMKIPCWLLGKVFAHLLTYITKQEVRRCMQVCMTWRQAISKFAEDNSPRRPYNESSAIVSSSSRAKISDIIDAKFKTLESINKFIQMNPRGI